MEKGPVITFDPTKEAINLEKHGVSLTLCVDVLAGRVFTTKDERFDYGEDRYVTYGYVDGCLHVVVWTHDADGRTIRSISLRKANKREQRTHG